MKKLSIRSTTLLAFAGLAIGASGCTVESAPPAAPVVHERRDPRGFTEQRHEQRSADPAREHERTAAPGGPSDDHETGGDSPGR
jgi:hypothetical protein